MRRRAFEALVERAISSIPEEFLGEVRNLSFHVEDWADDETLEEVGFEDPRDLLGFYRGWPMGERSHDEFTLPDVISLYQGAIENYAEETGDPVTRVIRETVMHELAHYFGFSEDEMDAVEDHWAGLSDAEDP